MVKIYSKVLKILLMTVFPAIVVTATFLKDSSNPTINRVTKVINSDFSNFHESDLKIAVKSTPDFLPVDASNNRKPLLCPCHDSTLMLMLAPLRGPEPPFKIKYVGSGAQTISVIDNNVVDCGLPDFISFCGPLEFLFIDTTTLEIINVWPYQDLNWDSMTYRLTLNHSSNSDLDLKLTISLVSDRNIKASEHIRIEVKKPINHRNLVDPVQTFCTGVTTNMNLLNSSVKVSQSGYNVGYNAYGEANVGCDGVFQYQTNDDSQPNVYDQSKVVSVLINPLFWKAEFLVSTQIETALIVTSYDLNTTEQYLQMSRMQMTMGNNSDPSTNPACNTQMTQSGWWKCSAKGTVWALYQLSNSLIVFYFPEVMLYSQEAIQINALSAYMNSTKIEINAAKLNNFAINALSNIMVMYSNTLSPACCITSTIVLSPTLKITLKAFGLIDGVALLPRGNKGAQILQVATDVYIRDVSGKLLFCGQLTNFNTYQEVKCGFVGDQVFVQHRSTGIQNLTLTMAGIGIFSSCDCAGSSFDPQYIPVVAVEDTFGQSVTFQVSSTDPIKLIKLNSKSPDTISTICGLADGFSKCGSRKFSFQEKTSGLTILKWPFKGLSWDEATSILTFNPAQATALCVLTATMKLENYPLVSRKQDISVVLTTITTEEPFATLEFKLTANINSPVILKLPTLVSQSSYVLTSTYNFAVSVNGNQLMVFSKNYLDVGQTQIQMAYISPSQNVPFQVKVKFLSTAQSEPAKDDSQKESDQTQNTTIVSTEPVSFLETMDCKEDEQGNVSCVDSKTGQICAIDLTDGKFKCGFQAHQTSEKRQEQQKIIARPTVKISEISHKAQFQLKFSEAMNLTYLRNTTNARRLKGGHTNSGKGSTAGHSINMDNLKEVQIIEKRYDYLLSDQFLDIYIEDNTEYNATQLQLDWFAFNITEDTIHVQIIFYDPLQISSVRGSPNKIVIGLLQGSFEAFTSLKTGLLVVKPLQIYTKILPTQVLLGSAIEKAQLASQSLTTLSQTSILSNAALQLFLSGAMDQMWMVINSLQIVLCMQYLQISMPANVNLIMNEVDNIASFNVFPTSTVMTYFFTFTTTKMPGVGFEAMGVYSKRLILYLGAIFLWMLVVVAQCVILFIAYMFRRCLKFFDRLSRMFQRQLIWSGLILTIIESQLDISAGILLSFEETHYETKSDIFDFTLSILFTPIVLGLPMFSFFYIRKHKNVIHETWFQEKFSGLTEGYHTTGLLGETATKYMISWFCTRRILTAIILVPLRTQTAWIPLSFNMWLCIFDLSIKLYLFPFEHKIRGCMEIFNDSIILISCYYYYLFTDLVPVQETRYNIGWSYIGLIGFMIVINMLVMLVCVFQDVVESCKRKCALQHNYRVMKARGIQIDDDDTPKMQMLARAIKIEELFYSPREPTLNMRLVKEIHDQMVGEVVAKKARDQQMKEFFEACDVLIQLEGEAIRDLPSARNQVHDEARENSPPARNQVQDEAREEFCIEMPFVRRPPIVPDQAKNKPNRKTVLRRVLDEMQERDDEAVVKINQPINLADLEQLLPTQFTNLSEGTQEWHIRDLLRYYEDDETKIQHQSQQNVEISEYEYYSDVQLETQRNGVQGRVGYMSDYYQEEEPQIKTDAMIKDIFNDL